MKIRLAKKIMKQVCRTRYWAWRFGYFHGKRDSGKLAGDHRLIKAMRMTGKLYHTIPTQLSQPSGGYKN